MFLLAVLPGILLFAIVWKFDKVEKEPPMLLLKLFAFGVLSILAAILLRTLLIKLLTPVFYGDTSLLFVFTDAFLVTALIEVGAKYLVLRLAAWKDRAFNYTFDAIVYAVTVSVGFVTGENIVYLIKYGSDLEPVRLLLPLISQIILAVYMGYFFGLAKLDEGRGNAKGKRLHLIEAFCVPFAMQGLYEFCLGGRRTSLYILFAVYVLLITGTSIYFFLRLSKGDSAIPGGDGPESAEKADTASASEDW
ncbi:MAG: PrsW family intramembrane metalloprotease [Lachnospiraceae bacterium]|nr:PrsW family intramembrane metalloprotease [Lachnospiraceae bacterium]